MCKVSKLLMLLLLEYHLRWKCQVTTCTFDVKFERSRRRWVRDVCAVRSIDSVQPSTPYNVLFLDSNTEWYLTTGTVHSAMLALTYTISTIIQCTTQYSTDDRMTGWPDDLWKGFDPPWEPSGFDHSMSSTHTHKRRSHTRAASTQTRGRKTAPIVIPVKVSGHCYCLYALLNQNKNIRCSCCRRRRRRTLSNRHLELYDRIDIVCNSVRKCQGLSATHWNI